ncbi:MAG TPA: branched-chain amino acid ABC transporter permease, partial [Deinococcales bacterium]|nr:branched-chain amino acid ABC transporter permease [Deinococcales bacterium]
ALEGFSLVVWGSQGNQLPPVIAGAAIIGGVPVRYQSFFVILTAGVLLAVLWAFFERTLHGKALRATAINRTGARLVGISPVAAGTVAWAVSAGLSALGGVLIAPLIIVNYDIGLPLGLKGFIGAVIGGMTSYPGAVAGGLTVGILESFSGYANSALREVIVYSLLFIILVYRTLREGARRRPPRRAAARRPA